MSTLKSVLNKAVGTVWRLGVVAKNCAIISHIISKEYNFDISIAVIAHIH